MKIKPYVDRLNNSKEYKEFQKKYSDAFMIAGFFILDLQQGNNLHQIDYYVPSEKKIAAFTIDGGVSMQMLNMMNVKLVPEKLDIKTNIDLDALYGILEDEMKNRSITEDVQKIIAILQTVDGKKVWNLNCILSGMGILKAHIDDDSQTILKMEKSSILDYVKKMPMSMDDLKGMKGMKGMKAIPGMDEEEAGKESKEELKEKIETLSKIEKEIETEKEKAEEQLEKKAKLAKSKKEKSIKSDKAEDKE
jgi:molybdopterin converting factor small subunit